jgi:RecA-family ATPase
MKDWQEFCDQFDQQPAEPAVKGEMAALPLLRFPDWHGRTIPEREWIVPDWIPCPNVTSLYGDGGLGKSLIAQQLLTSCATGKPWLGLGIEPCKSIGLFCEDDEHELLRRQRDINFAYRVCFNDLADMTTIAKRVGEDNTLMTFPRNGHGEVTALWRQFRQAALDFGARLAVVDTASDVFGGDENKRPEVRQFISACLGSLAIAINGAVLLCVHPSVRGMADGSGTGGSTAWNGTVRSRLYLTRPEPEDDNKPDPDLRTISRRKANYASVGDEIELRWQRGVFISQDAPEGGLMGAIDKRNKERAHEKAFLNLLDAAFASGLFPSPAKTSSTNYAPKLLHQLQEPDGKRLKIRELETAMARLFQKKSIRAEGVRNSQRKLVQSIVKVDQDGEDAS